MPSLSPASRSFLIGALRGAALCGLLGLFGPFLLWKLLNSSAVDPNSTYAWFRDIGFQGFPQPPPFALRPGLIAALCGGVLGGVLALPARASGIGDDPPDTPPRR